MQQETVPEILKNNPVEVSEVYEGCLVDCAGVTWSIMPSNFVMTGSLGRSVDTKLVSRQLGHYETKTRGVPGLHFKMVAPKGNVMIGEEGRSQAIGHESQNRALLSIHLAALQMVKELKIPVIPTNFYATNTTITVKPCNTEKRDKLLVSLETFVGRPEYERLFECDLSRIRNATFYYYHPELLSGNHVRVVIYKNGNFNIMGGQSEHRFVIARNIIRIFTYEFIRQMKEADTPVDPENIFKKVLKKRRKDHQQSPSPLKRSKYLSSPSP